VCVCVCLCVCVHVCACVCVRVCGGCEFLCQEKIRQALHLTVKTRSGRNWDSSSVFCDIVAVDVGIHLACMEFLCLIHLHYNIIINHAIYILYITLIY
jgi:hypothetical protein